MKKRLVSLAIILILLVGLAPAQAQEGDNYLVCGNLPEADCAILLASAMASDDVTSADMSFTMDLTLSGIAAVAAMFGASPDEAPAGDISFTVDGGGPFMLDTAAVPPMKGSFEFTFSGTDGSSREEGSIGVVILDGIIYVRDENGQWEGMTFEDLLESDPATASMLEGLLGGEPSELPEGALNPQDLMGGNTAELLEAAGLGPEVLDLVKTPGFITVTRLNDIEMMGQKMYVFETRLDTTPLFNSPDFQAFLNQALTAATSEDEDMAGMAMMVPMLLSSTTINLTATQMIGAADMIQHGLTVNLVATLDLGTMMAASGGQSQGQPQMPPLVLDVNVEILLDKVNQPFTITAPAGATMVKSS